MPKETNYNPFAMLSIIGGVVLVFAIFLAMLFSRNLTSPAPRPLPGDRQLLSNAP